LGKQHITKTNNNNTRTAGKHNKHMATIIIIKHKKTTNN